MKHTNKNLQYLSQHKNIKKKIFEKLDKDGYINDSELYKIYGKEPNYNTSEEYKRQWRMRKGLRDFFSDKEILAITKYRRSIRVSLDGEHWYRITKEYFEEIKPQFIRDYQRADLKEIEMYKKDTSITPNL